MTTSDSDSESEKYDKFIDDPNSFPSIDKPTRLTGTPPPPVTSWNNNISLKNCYNNHTNKNNVTFFNEKHNINSLTKSTNSYGLFKNYLDIVISIILMCIILISITLLMLSILTPETISTLFAPALNIIQTQFICGFGLVIGSILGISLLSTYNNNIDEQNFDDSNCSF